MNKIKKNILGEEGVLKSQDQLQQMLSQARKCLEENPEFLVDMLDEDLLNKADVGGLTDYNCKPLSDFFGGRSILMVSCQNKKYSTLFGPSSKDAKFDVKWLAKSAHNILVTESGVHVRNLMGIPKAWSEGQQHNVYISLDLLSEDEYGRLKIMKATSYNIFKHLASVNSTFKVFDNRIIALSLGLDPENLRRKIDVFNESYLDL